MQLTTSTRTCLMSDKKSRWNITVNAVNFRGINFSRLAAQKHVRGYA